MKFKFRDNLQFDLGMPFFEMCCFHIWAYMGHVKKQMKEIGSKKVLHGARFTEGGGEAIWAMPIGTTHFEKGLPIGSVSWEPGNQAKLVSRNTWLAQLLNSPL